MAHDQDHIRSFLEMLTAERGAAGNTIAAYTRDCDAFLGFLDTRGKSLAQTDTRDIQAYIHSLSVDGPRGGFARAQALVRPPVVQVSRRRKRPCGRSGRRHLRAEA